MTADEFYKLGNEYRCKGDWQHALDNYLEAIALDPQSPAVEAKRMLDDILAYRCKDMYNP
ncbi:tetratricopeptide repeat protein [Prevotella sp.]|uniref:tetratricopeptide repeat protein n=1 Tax=Prevotella sp. TaxID=59823 RepID=UPI0027E2CE6C|nr:tetratricopeptide repeat protein [Prevotella sp.]